MNLIALAYPAGIPVKQGILGKQPRHISNHTPCFSAFLDYGIDRFRKNKELQEFLWILIAGLGFFKDVFEFNGTYFS